MSPDRGWPKRLVNEGTTPPGTYRMGVVGDRRRHWGEESGKKSRLHLKETRVELEEVDSVETEACRARKFERRVSV